MRSKLYKLTFSGGKKSMENNIIELTTEIHFCPYCGSPNLVKDKGEDSINCDDCNRVLNKWLDEYDNQIRADAIDEFADNIKKYYASKKEMGYVATTYENLMISIDELSERLKKGVKE